MLAGCSSSTLVSPRHRLRSEGSGQFQACHLKSSMNTQRLDLPCSLSRKDASRSQSIKPVGLSVEKPIEAKASGCSLKQNIRLPPLAIGGHATGSQAPFLEGRREIKNEFWEKRSSLKRYAEQGDFDESCIGRAKRKRSCNDSGESDQIHQGGEVLSLGQLGSKNIWFQPSFEVTHGCTGLGSHIPFTLTTTGEEDKVCYVPGDLITPPLPLPNNPWVESVVTKITNLGGRDGQTSHRPVNEASSGSSASSESRGLAIRPSEDISEQEVGNGSGNPYPREGAAVEAGGNNLGEYQGFELVDSIVRCVEAISSRNIPAINHFIAKLGETASPRGTPIARLAAYYTEALAFRVARFWPNIFSITPPRELDRMDDDSSTALRLFNQVSPIPKFIHFTANEILLRAFEGKDRVHIIDFDIKQGLQWPSFFQSLALRTNPPSHVRITGIGECKQDLIETGDRLAVFAEALNLPFEFHPVVDRLEDVRLWMLHVKENESVAVNCLFQLHKTLYDASGAVFRDFIGVIRSTNPTVVIMAEQEAEHNEPRLDRRVCRSMRYYSALFDLLDSSLPLDSPNRIKIEQMFAREIRNLVACEGSDRLERHDIFGNWRERMEQEGFRCIGINEREMLQSQMLLQMYSSEGFSVKKQGQDALTLAWLDQPLYTVSAWTMSDLAGSSSTFPRSS